MFPNLSRLGEPDRKACRRYPLEPQAVYLAAFAALDVELDVDDALGPIILGLARQRIDDRLTVGLCA